MPYDDQYDDRRPPLNPPPAQWRPAGPYPPPVYPAPPQQRRRRRWPWVVGGLLLALVIISMLANSTNPRNPSPPGPPVAVSGPSGMTSVGPVPSNGGGDSMDVQEDATAAPETNTRYAVTGSGRADITYSTDQGMEQRLNVALPFYADVNVTLASISAQRKSGKAGEVVCVIEARGEQIARTTGQGAYAICAASGI